MELGYIKLWRRLRDHPIKRDKNALLVLIDILLNAEWKDGRVKMVDGKEVILKAGQITTGRKQLALSVGLSQSTVRHALKRLVSKYGIVAIQKASQFSIVTICKWREYQHNKNDQGQLLGQDEASLRPAQGQLEATPEEVKHLSIKELKKKEEIAGSLRKAKRYQPTDEEFLTMLKNNRAYAGIDIDRELAKMDAWIISRTGITKTRRRIVNWLNRIEKPFKTTQAQVRKNKCFVCSAMIPVDQEAHHMEKHRLDREAELEQIPQ